MNKKYPTLFDLLAGPFYQCWYEYDDRCADDIVNDSINQASAEERMLASKEIEKIISTYKDDSDLGRVIGIEIGCNYSPTDDGLSNLEWLLSLKEKLAR